MNVLRKVQQTPGGTFFVCVPKSWAKQTGLTRGAVVALRQTSDGKLLIDSKYGSPPVSNAVSLKTGPYLSREIIGQYLLGFDVIRIESKGGINFSVRETVKAAVEGLIGLEIIEEDYSNIVLQCLLEPSGFPPEKILRRGYAITAGMHRDVIKALVEGDASLAKSVMARDAEANRLYFLVVRILRTIIQNPSLSEKLGVTPIDCLDYRLVASLVEAIGDECVHAASKVSDLKGSKLTASLKKLLVEFDAICYGAHEDAVTAFLVGDVALAEDIRGMREKMEKASATIEEVARAGSLDIVPQVLAAASFLRQIYEHSVDIADLVVPRKQ